MLTMRNEVGEEWDRTTDGNYPFYLLNYTHPYVGADRGTRTPLSNAWKAHDPTRRLTRNMFNW
jgi:hypothetical protein